MRKAAVSIATRYVWDGAVEVYHQDHLGSVRELTDSDGHITSIYLTDEYGVLTTLQRTDGTPATGSDQLFWFTDGRWQSESLRLSGGSRGCGGRWARRLCGCALSPNHT